MGNKNLFENTTNFFLLGLKPAVLVCEKKIDYELLLKFNFPYIKYQNHNVLFFKSKKWKKQYLLREKVLPKDNLFGFNDMNMGIVLGYPPNAIKNYNETTCFDRVQVDFHGITFATSRKDFWSDFNWLMERYPIPEPFKGNITIEILNGGGKTRRETSQFIHCEQVDSKVCKEISEKLASNY